MLDSRLSEVGILLGLLKACARGKDVKAGNILHADILKRGLFGKNPHIDCALINLYARCGSLDKAQEVFENIQDPNVLSCNALLSAYSQHGRCLDTLIRFDRMQCESISPNAITFVYILKACGSIGSLKNGRSVHARIIKDNHLGCNVFVGTSMLDMYAKCGELAMAQKEFDFLQYHDLVSWNAVMHGYSLYGHVKEAYACFERMQCEAQFPNSVTILCMLRACIAVGALDRGKIIHSRIVGHELPPSLGSALVDMYVKCGNLEKAEEVFREINVRNVVCWTALLAGYTQHGQGEEALNCFEQMQREGISPSAVTYVCILKACGSIRALEKGKIVHADIVREGLLVKNVLVGNALVDMYAKCGSLKKAHEVFNELHVRDVISWNAIITGFTRLGHWEEVMNYFEQMQHEGLHPDHCTFFAILRVCGSIGAIERGTEAHNMIVHEGLLEKDISIGNALVDMYAKCGALTKAQEVFNKLPVPNVVSWTGLISGYAQLGKDVTVVKLFNKMIQEGIRPNVVTFTVMLNACRHSGLLHKGDMYFDAMYTQYGVIPTMEHNTCMVDLFGRAGQFDKAVSLIKRIPNSDCLPIWTTLLGACQTWRNLTLGRQAFEHAVRLNEMDDAMYICMSNIYVAGSM